MHKSRDGAQAAGRRSHRMGWSYRLYIRIYLAVLASLAVAALLFAIVAHMNSDAGQFGANLQTFADIAAEVLPSADAPQEVQRAALIRWQRRVRADLALYAADGSLIAEAGMKMPPLPPDQVDSGWLRGHQQVLVLKLPDGRWLLEQRLHLRHLSSVGLLAALTLIALGIGLGAYPIVRRLTRRLERLQRSVDSWGSGQLSVRVPVEGHDEVARLATSFNRSAARIELLVNAQRSLLANASHELRSPLARIRMAVELMRAQADPAVSEELSRNISELDQLIDEILLASRLDATGEQIPSPEEFDLTALVAEECAQTGAILSAEKISMRGEPKLIRRMVRNLLENARRYGAGTTIEVNLNAGGEHAIRLDVCERGPGVPEAEREHIFAPFYRVPGARESDGGVGLGLSLVRQIARRHGGDVQCLAREGGGSCFRVSLPE